MTSANTVSPGGKKGNNEAETSVLERTRVCACACAAGVKMTQRSHVKRCGNLTVAGA